MYKEFTKDPANPFELYETDDPVMAELKYLGWVGASGLYHDDTCHLVIKSDNPSVLNAYYDITKYREYKSDYDREREVERACSMWASPDIALIRTGSAWVNPTSYNLLALREFCITTDAEEFPLEQLALKMGLSRQEFSALLSSDNQVVPYTVWRILLEISGFKLPEIDSDLVPNNLIEKINNT